jgi:hypothetical protein
MNTWAFRRWLVAEIGRAEKEYREDKKMYQLDETVLPYFCGRVEALKKVLRVLTGKEKGLR